MRLTRQGILFGMAAALLAANGVGIFAQQLGPATVKGNISVQLPAGWVPGDGAGKTLLVALAPARDKDATGEYQASLSITQDKGGGKIDGAAQQARLSADVKGYKATELPQNVTINGVQGVCFGGTITNGALVLRSRQYMFSTNNQIYVITFTSLNSKFDAYGPIVGASVGTFIVSK